MSTTAQITANRLNAQSSTGPSTPEGQAASSRNATTHGLSGQFLVLPHESQDEFNRLLAGYRRKFAPADDHEMFLVEQLVQSRWNTARLRRLETSVIRQMTAHAQDSSGPDDTIAVALLHGSANVYAQLQRYAAAAERSYYRALRELERGRPAAATDQQPPPRPVLVAPSKSALQNEPDFTLAAQALPPVDITSRNPRHSRADYPANLALCL